MTEIILSQKLRKDVYSICSNIYTMNAPDSIGYVFNENSRNTIAVGMFCNFRSEINFDEWDYFFDFKTKKFYEE